MWLSYLLKKIFGPCAEKCWAPWPLTTAITAMHVALFSSSSIHLPLTQHGNRQRPTGQFCPWLLSCTLGVRDPPSCSQWTSGQCIHIHMQNTTFMHNGILRFHHLQDPSPQFAFRITHLFQGTKRDGR